MKRKSSKKKKKSAAKKEGKTKVKRPNKRPDADPTRAMKRAVAEALRHAEAEYHSAQLHLTSGFRDAGARQRYVDALREHWCLQEAAMRLAYAKPHSVSGT